MSTSFYKPRAAGEMLLEYLSPITQPVFRLTVLGPPLVMSFSLHRDSETDGRDQTIALEECNQEGEPGANTSSPSSVSQETSVELPVPI